MPSNFACNPGHNILRLLDVLPNLRYIRVASGVAERLNP